MELTAALARTVRLLEEIKTESKELADRTSFASAISIHTKATEAQNILVGADPTVGSDN